jgi:hypothetical protein
MGVNLASLQSPLGLPGSPGRRLAPRGRVLFVNTSKSRDQSAKKYKTLQIRSKLPQNLL